MRRRNLASIAATAGILTGLAVAAEPASAATPDCSSYTHVRTGQVSAGQTSTPWSYFFTIKSPGPVELCLDGPDGSEVSLVLYRLIPGGSMPVAVAPSSGSDKTLTYIGSQSAYRADLITNVGSGAYTIGLNLP